MSRTELSFEEAFQKLEETVRILETGGLKLEEAIALYEEGMRLAKLCNECLDAAELKMTQLQLSLEERTKLFEDKDK